MSGSWTSPAPENLNNGYAELGVDAPVLSSNLRTLLEAEDIVPGSQPSYQTAKNIYLYHPLGARIAEQPIALAQSQGREIKIPGGPQARLVEAFEKEARKLGGPDISEDIIVRRLHTIKRIYGIAALLIGDRSGKMKPGDPLLIDKLHELDLYFNVLDPLNTAGSLVLDQDPNSPDFQRARHIAVAGIRYHPSRALVVMHEQPIYIEFTDSAFGFVGRSVYQRALFPLKTFVTTMLTDDYVARKVGLLIAKVDSPGSILTRTMQSLFGIKMGRLKSGQTGNVLAIGKDEDVASINFQNLQGAGEFARSNCLKNIGSAVPMPAKMLDQETLVSGFGEGSEDAKQIAKYVENIRDELGPTYELLDTVTQRRAWSPEFYEAIQRDMPDQYVDVPYETAFYQWHNSFVAAWPNLLQEPDSERVKVDETRFKSAVALFEVMAPKLDPDSAADMIDWLAGEINERRELFAKPLLLDTNKIAEFLASQPPDLGTRGDEAKVPEPTPFSART